MDNKPNTKTAKTTAFTKEDIEKNKVWAVVSYLGFIGIIIVLLTEGKDSPFAKFHLNQSLPLMIAAIGGSIIAGVIPILGWFVLAPLVSIGALVLAIMGIVNAAQGEAKRLPLVGNFELIK